MFKFLIYTSVFLCIGWFGVKYYFTHVNRIADQVRSDVLTHVQTHHSQFLTYNDIPEIYRDAIISTEDRSFFTNRGIDLRGTLRAVSVDIGSGQARQGGSTITQQLIHNTLLSNMSKSLTWKLLESIYAIGVYDSMSKQETFAFYTNVIYFGHGANGLYQAAETYFGKPPSELNAGELTMLAGLPNAPSNYDPYHNMKLARERQHIVVQSMVDNGEISESQAKKIISEPIAGKIE
ncbi:biosynthetic peptidoglycan transglycosylase [Desulfosporosinus sp. Sb-LF]|uniref:biosynthetic peptidoglycan transglycosylase n=1 Tax=Desulfosporosinus sp. Sb-LF TaxID=2560027 RepID=UPI001FB05F5E|nr:biosynthetic peptidoglycan transglycosylase [Desulfosporosinus sp. Sb-LF]